MQIKTWIINRSSASFVAVTLAAGLTVAANELAAQDNGEINALIWCDHADPALLEPFEEEHGVTVNVKEYEGTGTALALLEQSQPGDWDVFVVDGVDVPRVVEAGYLAPLNADDFPIDDIFPGLAESEIHWIDGNIYAVPEKFGYNTISFNSANVDAGDMRHVDVLWADTYDGRIAIYDYYIPVITMVAIGLGLMDDGVISEDELPAIREKLLAMKDRSAMVGEVVAVQTAIATGDVDIIAGGGEWVTAVLASEDPNMDWVMPDEGGVRWSQSIGVFADSQNPEMATKFVQYILSPEGQARLATSSCYWAMPANTKAALDDDQKAILRWDEQNGFIENSHPYFIPDADMDAKFLEIWTEMLQH
ncbi:MAG: extracellular solute-binding protein [Pseudomonadota bacterium]